MVYDRDDIVGLDAAIIMNPEVWKASGHLDAFTDPLVECKDCHSRYRKDQIDQALDTLKKKVRGVVNVSLDKKTKAHTVIGITNRCPNCGAQNWTEPKTFNLLTEVYLGVTEPKQKAYLRGEITQGAFVNFSNVVASTRIQIPFGIAQIGKAFRNEITPGNFTFRSREFEQMEVEYFIQPDEKEGQSFFNYWKEQRLKWYLDLGIRRANLRFREHAPDERAHYARFAEDIEYNSPFGWKEFEGIHHRGDWDLSRHHLIYKDNTSDKEYTPWVIETSGGVDRAALFFLIDAYHHDDKRIVLKLHPALAPYQVAVFPLLANKPNLINTARKVFGLLKPHFHTAWDDRDNIGKRYFAQDEIGTPWCVTIDFDTLKNQTVTIRDRDTAKQVRLPIDKLVGYFQKQLAAL